MTRKFTPSPAHDRESIVHWLELVLEGTAWSPTRLAKEAGVAPSTVNRMLAGDADHMLSATTLGRIEQAASSRIRERIAAGELDWKMDSHPGENMRQIKEIDPRDHGGEVATWGFPEIWFRFTFGNHDPTDCRVMAVEDEGMWPDLKIGDRVLVDTTMTTGSPAGIYMVHDGHSWTPRRFELLVGSAPRSAVLRPKNPEFMNHEVQVDSVRILGRVIGMWRRI